MKTFGLRKQLGLSLVELLVTLIVTGLVTTLLIQGGGFFLNSYQRVLNKQTDANRQAMALSWFRESVAGSLASLDSGFTFSGSGDSFTFVTINPVSGTAGPLTPETWSLRQNGANYELWVQSRDANAVLVDYWQADNASINYRGQSGEWGNSWPLDDTPTGGLPWRIKLSLFVVGNPQPVEIYAAVQGRRLPWADYRDLL